MSDDLFPGFDQRVVAGDGADIFLRTGGKGPPLCLLHGFPQSHHMWHKVAPALAERFSLILPDLRGYGLSSTPRNTADNAPYSKRAMARDVVKVMGELGHEQFLLAGHDRGGRVAYRLALDHPERVEKLALLDIISTADQWRAFDAEEANKTYHWPFLAQAAPLPETLIGANPVFYLDWTLASWTASRDLTPFDERALAQYRLNFAAPERIEAACNDYRAGATIDRELDEADLAAGNKIKCPLLALWGERGLPGKGKKSPLDHWAKWCDRVEGEAIAGGHFLAEEAPEETARLLARFFGG